MADKLGIGTEARELKLGRSFDNDGTLALHSVRYDFKPASMDSTRMSTMDIGEGNQVTVTVPHVEGCGTTHTVYKGNKRPVQKECILIIDHKTGEIKLEKLTNTIQLKKTRSSKRYCELENRNKDPPNPTSTVIEADGIKTGNHMNPAELDKSKEKNTSNVCLRTHATGCAEMHIRPKIGKIMNRIKSNNISNTTNTKGTHLKSEQIVGIGKKVTEGIVKKKKCKDKNTEESDGNFEDVNESEAKLTGGKAQQKGLYDIPYQSNIKSFQFKVGASYKNLLDPIRQDEANTAQADKTLPLKMENLHVSEICHLDLVTYAKAIHCDIAKYIESHQMCTERKPYVSRHCSPQQLQRNHSELYDKIVERLSVDQHQLDALNTYLIEEFPSHLVGTKHIYGLVQRLEDVSDFVIENYKTRQCKITKK